MKIKYKFKFYVNARHSVNFSGIQSAIHPHTWEIVMFIDVNSEAFLNFSDLEKTASEYFEKYEGSYLNELDEFKTVEPTMENIALKIFNDLKDNLSKEINISRVEVSENPTRTYIIEK